MVYFGVSTMDIPVHVFIHILLAHAHQYNLMRKIYLSVNDMTCFLRSVASVETKNNLSLKCST